MHTQVRRDGRPLAQATEFWSVICPLKPVFAENFDKKSLLLLDISFVQKRRTPNLQNTHNPFQQNGQFWKINWWLGCAGGEICYSSTPRLTRPKSTISTRCLFNKTARFFCSWGSLVNDYGCSLETLSSHNHSHGVGLHVCQQVLDKLNDSNALWRRVFVTQPARTVFGYHKLLRQTQAKHENALYINLRLALLYLQIYWLYSI